MRSKFSTTKFAKTRALPKVFTEKGLYMIAIILKSKQATDATFAIIETFLKIRQLSRSIQELSAVKDKTHKNALMSHFDLVQLIVYNRNQNLREAAIHARYLVRTNQAKRIALMHPWT